MVSRSGLAWLASLALLAPCLPAQAESTRLWSFKPDRGFVDEPVAFSADDARFAWVHTDAAEFLKVLVLRTEGFQKELEIDVAEVTLVPRQLAFSPDAGRLSLVAMDGHSGAHRALVYELPSGKLLKKLGPATAAAIADCGGEQCITLTATRSAGGTTTHSLSAFRVRDLKRLGAGSVSLRPDQTLKAPPLRLLYFEPANLTLMGTEKGKYDPKRDVRLPDRSVRWSLLQRKEVWAEEPKELIPWTRAINMRPGHPGQLRFVQVSEDHKQLLYVDASNQLATLTVPARWGLYEPKSLTQAESWDARNLYFSLTIDPVNAEAVRRKKADKERVDLYRVDQGPRARLLGQVYTGQRGFLWSVGSQHFSYLRRMKGFARGGTELQLYKIGR